MFSIHCTVLRLGRQKKEESILVQNKEVKTINWGGGGLTTETPSSCCYSHLLTKVPLKDKDIRCEGPERR